MSFNIDTSEVLRQFANVFGSLSPLIWLFVGAVLGLFLFGGLVTIFKKFNS